jgi:lysophospholipid hydrolase
MELGGWGCGTVGSKDTENLTNYGDELSGWWVLWKRWNPFTSAVVIPSMADVSSRLAYIQSTQHLASVNDDRLFDMTTQAHPAF